MFVTRPLSLTTAHVWQGSSAVQGAESAVAEFIGSRDAEISASAINVTFFIFLVCTQK
jgi:hypothetical protein